MANLIPILLFEGLRIMKRSQLIALTIALALSLSQAQADWPQFLGPNRNGISNEKGLARSWPANGPKVLWTQKVGPGFGGASISKDQVFLLDRQDDERDLLRCLSFTSGKKIWEYAYKFPGRLSHNGSRSVPTVDDDRIFAVGPFGHLYCVDRSAGKLLWGVDMVDEFQAKTPMWGFAQSPLMVKNLVIIAPMTERVGLVALDKKSGKTVWKSPSVGKQSYTSPMLLTIAGVKGILFFGSDQISFIDPKNGDMIWNYNGYYCRNQIASPLVIKGDRIFMTGGYGAGSAMIQINSKNGKYDIEEIF
ncbi:MAG: PQQ-like beta-propeller repeat protein, partial [Planctomycetes bacterium]|nr:PQQ-like beta-propeller repeat protein [Planctomycetota bacterium]